MCKYCERNEDMYEFSFDEDRQISIVFDENTNKYSLEIVASGEAYDLSSDPSGGYYACFNSISLNYCPMCGRQLTVEE